MKNVRNYGDSVHFYGRVWTIAGLLILMMVPAAVCLKYNAWPEFSGFFKGFIGIAPMFWTVTVIEVITYVPMLGTGGSYLGFMTGNLTNLKVPCALNAMESAEAEAGTEEGEVVSTIAIAVSAITTTVIIAVGVLLFSTIRPILEAPVLKPAFDHVLPALFGGLAVVFISKNWKIAVAPIVFMVALFVAVPSLSGSVGILVPVGALITIGVARLLYKRGRL